MTAVDGPQTEMMRETVPFAGALGVEVVESGPQAVRARVEWRPERCTAGGVLHGGVIMGLADTTGAAGRAVAKVLQTQAVLRGVDIERVFDKLTLLP